MWNAHTHIYTSFKVRKKNKRSNLIPQDKKYNFFAIIICKIFISCMVRSSWSFISYTIFFIT